MKQTIIYFLSIILLGLSDTINAQEKDIINNTFTNSSQFLFNEFQEGDIYFKDGNISTAELNYNVFFQEILFMKDEQSFVLNMLDKIDSIKFNKLEFVVLNSDIYQSLIFSKNYMILKELKIDIGSVSNTTGAYGTSTETSATEEWKYMIDKPSGASRYPNIQSENEKEFKLITRYYIIKDNKKDILTKKRLMKIFPDKKDQIKNYVKENKTSFSSDNDVIAFFNDIIK